MQVPPHRRSRTHRTCQSQVVSSHRGRDRLDRAGPSHSHRRPLDSATGPRIVETRLTDRGCFRPWRRTTPSSPWSPTDVQMCHLAGSNSLPAQRYPSRRPRTPGGVKHSPEPVTEPLGLARRPRRFTDAHGAWRNVRRSGTTGASPLSWEPVEGSICLLSAEPFLNTEQN